MIENRISLIEETVLIEYLLDFYMVKELEPNRMYIPNILFSDAKLKHCLFNLCSFEDIYCNICAWKVVSWQKR